MKKVASARRPRRFSMVMIVTSIGVSVAISLAMDIVLLSEASAVPATIAVAAVLFNITVILLSGVGGIIEWRRPGHTIGRLLMLSGPLYAYLAAGWLTAETIKPLMDPGIYRVYNWTGSFLSWPGVALIVGWIPLLFPTGTLPGPRWRIPVVILVIVSGITLAALAAQSSPSADGSQQVSPAALVNAISLELLALVVLAAGALVTRYRRGDQVERLQIRWFGTAVAICLIGFAGTAVQAVVQSDGGPLLMTLVLYAGILALPIAIGIAVTRYRLYEIDRLISRTIGWALLTGVLVAVFTGGLLALQALLVGFTEGQTLAVAASTLAAFALFQPVRRRIQHAVDRRFDRARYDGARTAAAFAERLHDQVDLATLEADVIDTVGVALRPASTSLWIRSASRHASPRTSP